MYDRPEDQTQFFDILCKNRNISITFLCACAAQLQCLSVLTSQLFPPLVPVVRPDKEDSSCHKERGNLRLYTGRGSPRPLFPSLPSTFPQTPFKGVPQEPLCQQAAKQCETYSGITHISASHSRVHKYPIYQ